MLELDLSEDDRQLGDELLLLVVLPKDGGHLPLQVADDVRMDLAGREEPVMRCSLILTLLRLGNSL